MEAEHAYRKLIRKIINNEITDPKSLAAEKKKIAKICGLNKIPSNADILTFCNDYERAAALSMLQKKPVRTISGVAVIATMTSPAPCPHGKCIPCPGGPDTPFKSAQSYMGSEPASLRAVEHNYHPYKQVAARVRQLQIIGHPVNKAELIIMGGTFTARDPSYQQWFIKECFAALNDYGKPENNSSDRSLLELQRENETALVRNVGMTIETRPDYSKEKHIDEILKLGATKVELGVQTTDNKILENINRGHTVEDTIQANTLLRDSCFKVGFHIMPGLPGTTIESDLNVFKKLFENPDFMPDYLKIYPTLVTEGTELEKLWRAGDYTPLENEAAVELIAQVKSILPMYVRLQRVQRDIPVQQILAGVTKSHIRQLAAKRLADMGKSCQCIRCREVGHQQLKGRSPGEVIQQIHTYRACGSIEHFISYEDITQKIVIGFVRLRFPYHTHQNELENAALIRELHVYGKLVPVGTKDKEAWQHQGYGEKLLHTAEETAQDAGYKKIAIISGVGVREYYRKLGYGQEGCYMINRL
ncbi:MAG: elongator complex protein 3 [Candidatus Argoarchaeum ethanivorans]|uniref:tRNA carboxymethyluridine synthase n=1 Tax=Candidatus Argoarchaeum ethanivorans TaxID=2608793 RepID=A0A8B3S4Z8_9EURY|nr:MAG: elongator complex protein 3 [Candidatus Argoarchaeum ethanivorans]